MISLNYCFLIEKGVSKRNNYRFFVLIILLSVSCASQSTYSIFILQLEESAAKKSTNIGHNSAQDSSPNEVDDRDYQGPVLESG